MSATATLPPAAVLLLARLLAAGDKGETRDKVRKELEPLLGHRWSGGALTDLIDQTGSDLIAAGLVVRVTTGKGKKATERLSLTDAGRHRGLSLLKVDQLPPKTTWATLKKVYLPERVLLPAGREAPTAEARPEGVLPGVASSRPCDDRVRMASRAAP
jgi:hypothetical protein